MNNSCSSVLFSLFVFDEIRKYNRGNSLALLRASCINISIHFLCAGNCLARILKWQFLEIEIVFDISVYSRVASLLRCYGWSIKWYAVCLSKMRLILLIATTNRFENTVQRGYSWAMAFLCKNEGLHKTISFVKLLPMHRCNTVSFAF